MPFLIRTMRTTLLVRTWLPWLLSLVFLVAGVGKLMDYNRPQLSGLFARDGEAIYPLVLSVEATIPSWELVVALAMAVPGLRRSGCLLGLVLCALFMTVGMVIPDGTTCSCFGVIGGMESRIGRFVTIATLALACIVVARTKGGLRPRTTKRDKTTPDEPLSAPDGRTQQAVRPP